MRLGLFGARADKRGLSYQTASFAKWLKPDRVLGVDMTSDKLSPYPCDWSSYDPRTLTVRKNSVISEREVKSWLRGLDVVIGAETFYRDEFPNWAREIGVRTVLQINPEFVSWWRPNNADPKPDILISPSTWRLDNMPGVTHLPFPVDRDLFPFVLRTSANHFVHVAGHAAAADRSGTRMVLGAAPHLRNLSTKITIRSQSPLGFTSPSTRYVTIEEQQHPDRSDLYSDADVLILPRRYGGQSLVANEALSSGIPIIVLNRSPDNTWGGSYPIRCRVRGQLRTKAGHIPLHEALHGALPEAIKCLAADDDLVTELSHRANVYAESISWKCLLPAYRELLTSLS